jgi:acetyl-CoA carboxylase biotin carboxyl carrier protein
MNIKEIEDLIKFVAKSGVSEVELESKDFKIIIKTESKNRDAKTVVISQPAPQQVHVQAPVTQVASAPASTHAIQPPAPVAKPAEDANLVVIKSPMIGTFYRASSPDKPLFVNVGDEVTPGKILCVIEAMKLFNEIECEVSGTIVKVLVDNASPVEYDQPLFLVQPK